MLSSRALFKRPILLSFQISRAPSRFFSVHTAFSMPATQSVSIASAHDFLDFVNASPTPYHAVNSAVQRLTKAGFKEIRERDNWSTSLVPGGKYYLTRNASTIVAFAIGKKWQPGNPVAMIGAHTDSPSLRIKPNSKQTNAGFLQIGVETYGGLIAHTWFDRDLSIAGRAMVKDGKGNFVHKLVKIDRPIIRIPNLAIHLHRQDNFQPNKETELFPIAGLVAAELNRTGATASTKSEDAGVAADENEDVQPLKALSERHHPYVIELIAEEAGVEANDVVDFEMILYDTQKSCIGGLNNELIFSGRLDNLEMTYCSVMGLIRSVESSALDNESSIRLITCFDHEEIGSKSAQGADSNMLPAVVRRLSIIPSGQHEANSEQSYDRMIDLEMATAYEQTLATSFLISADMAHSVNPNYVAKYESEHRPLMNQGTVIKINANQRYATNSPGIVLLQEVAKRAKPSEEGETKVGVPLQLFVVRNDSPCGSTIGPMLSASLGTRTLDLGNPQLAMHSIRETGGVYDIEYAIRLFDSYFEHFSELERKILVD